MRKSRREAEQTRARIVSAAAKEFAEKGIESTGLAEVMTAAGLTHGGFYKHFYSKDQLVTEAFAQSLEDTLATMEGKPLPAIAAQYLSKEHRDTFEVACPYASMGTELRHADEDTQKASSDGVSKFIDVIAESLTELPKQERKARAQAILSALVGSLLLSRLVREPKLSDDILANTRKFLLARNAP